MTLARCKAFFLMYRPFRTPHAISVHSIFVASACLYLPLPPSLPPSWLLVSAPNLPIFSRLAPPPPLSCNLPSVPLLTEYAFYLRPGGLLYMITGECFQNLPPADVVNCRSTPWVPTACAGRRLTHEEILLLGHPWRVVSTSSSTQYEATFTR